MMRLILLFLFAQSHGQIEIQTLVGSWPTATKGILAGLVAAFVLVGGALVALDLLKRARLARERKEASWTEFTGLAQKAGLNNNELMLLKRVAGYSGIDPITGVFTQPWAFEKGVDEEIDFCQKDPVLLNNVCDSISGLRKKLGFHQIPPGTPYYSSRELPVGQDVNLYLPENPMIKYRSVVQHLNELELIVKRPELKEGSPAFKQGMGALGLMVSLYKPGDAEYSFKTKILRESADKQFLALEHSLSMERKQLRDYVRLEVRNQTKFRFVKSTADKELMKGGTRFSGTIVDISGGGCNLQTTEPYHAGDVIMMSFNFMGEAFYGVKGEILRMKQKTVSGAPAYFHPIRFMDIENNIRERIISLIFEKQREEVQWQKTSPYA